MIIIYMILALIVLILFDRMILKSDKHYEEMERYWKSNSYEDLDSWN